MPNSPRSLSLERGGGRGRMARRAVPTSAFFSLTQSAPTTSSSCSTTGISTGAGTSAATEDEENVSRLMISAFRTKLLRRVMKRKVFCCGQSGEHDELHRLLRNDGVLKRLLSARNGHMEKACRLAVNVCHWRAKVQPSRLTVHDFPVANAQGSWRFAGYTKEGWPILLIQVKYWEPSQYSTEEFVKMVAYFMEACHHHHNNNNNNSGQQPPSVLLLIDLDGMNCMKNDLNKLRQLVHIVQDCYPDSLGMVIACNLDPVSAAVFSLLYPLIRGEMQKKIHLFRPGMHVEFLKDHVALDQIETHLGGTRPHPWPPLAKDCTMQ